MAVMDNQTPSGVLEVIKMAKLQKMINTISIKPQGASRDIFVWQKLWELFFFFFFWGGGVVMLVCFANLWVSKKVRVLCGCEIRVWFFCLFRTCEKWDGNCNVCWYRLLVFTNLDLFQSVLIDSLIVHSIIQLARLYQHRTIAETNRSRRHRHGC